MAGPNGSTPDPDQFAKALAPYFEKVGEKIDRMGEKIDKVGEKIDGLGVRFDRHLELAGQENVELKVRVTSLEARVNALERRSSS